jgi:hypothetical protein
MADSRITALTALTAADPVNDMFPVVDVSDTTMAASGTTKKISVNNILGASGTATLASATITGDLTVDTNVLKVDSTNNRVGIGTATPASLFNVYRSTVGEVARFVGSTDSLGEFTLTSSDNVGSGRTWTRNGASAFAQHIWQINSSNAMTLNSTGLGVSGIPVNPLTAYGAAIAKAPVLFLTNVGSPGDYGWDFSVDGAVNGNLFIRRVNAYTKNDVLEFDRANGNLIMTPSTTATALTVNGQLTFNATSNTNLRFSYRGSDGTTRVANITLA